MNASDPSDLMEVAKSHTAANDRSIEKDAVTTVHDQTAIVERESSSPKSSDGSFPSNEELKSLRRVAGQVPWTAFTIAFVELCERFSYYGTTAVCAFVF